jgi:Zn-finger nucleic acid-binding protein
MRCPGCKSIMHNKKYESSSVGECQSCRSIWLPGSALSIILHDKSRTFSGDEAREVLTALEHMPEGTRQLSCPICKEVLDCHSYAGRSDIHIDRCPNDHGIFLDGSELEGIQLIFEDHGQGGPETATKSRSHNAAPGLKRCPQDGSALTSDRYETQMIERCSQCGGIWCDDKELGEIVKSREIKHGDELFPEYSGMEKDAKPTAAQNFSSNLACVVCGKPMIHLNYCMNSGIMIDTCRDGHGVWLDREELKRIEVFAERWDRNSKEIYAHYSLKLKAISAEVSAKFDADIEAAKRQGEQMSAIGRFLRSITW